MKSSKAAFLLYFLGVSIALWAQPAKDWDMTIGSSNWDELRLLVPLDNDAYLLGGGVSGAGGSTAATHFGYYEGYVEVRDKNKEKLWSATFGGTEDDKFHSALALADGSFLLGGYSASSPSGNKTTINYGKKDFWIVKVNSAGQKLWERSYGGTDDDEIFCMTELANSNFLLVGTSTSGADGVKTTINLGKDDIWVLQISANGTLLSQQTFGGEKNENLFEIVPTTDGGFLLGGATKSEISSTVSQTGRGQADFWVVKINADGFYQWDKRYGGNSDDQMYDLVALQKGGFLLTGASISSISGDKTTSHYGSYDIWSLKIDNDGNILWQQSFGGAGLDVSYAAVEAPTGHIFVGGLSDSPAGPSKTSNNIGSYDYWLLYLDQDGNALWDKCYGGSASDALTKMEMNENGSLMLAGNSLSNTSVFKSDNSYGFNDFWLLKTYCGVSLELETDKPLYCSGQEAIVIASAKNCAGSLCNITWENGAVSGDEYVLLMESSQLLTAMVRDNSGCTAYAAITLQITAPPTVSLGSDTTIHVSTNLVLAANVFPYSNDLKYTWSTGETNASKVIKETGTYSISVTNAAGCEASDSIHICICLGNTVYIPNVFQPDGDFYNDTWYILGNEISVKKLRSIQVMDNWGVLVFENSDIAINDKSVGWNGTFQGKILPPSVFTYAVDVEYVDGKSEVLFGTVTIVR